MAMRRYLGRLPADGCPRVNGGSNCDSLKGIRVELVALLLRRCHLQVVRVGCCVGFSLKTRTAENHCRHITRDVC
jgi:hypothetical protein